MVLQPHQADKPHIVQSIPDNQTDVSDGYRHDEFQLDGNG